MPYTEVATIDKTYERAKTEGLGLSKTFLRRHCLDGSLHATKTGNKYLIFWPNLLELLKQGEVKEEAFSATVSKIRPIRA